MSNGIKLVVTHSDFEERSARDGFVKLLLQNWPEVREGQGIDQTPIFQVQDEEPEVWLFFAYGESGLDVRDAELSVAATMATVSLYVMQANQMSGESSVYPAHGFAIERDVSMPVSEQESEAAPKRRIAARSSN